jgi:hypothetical protein
MGALPLPADFPKSPLGENAKVYEDRQDGKNEDNSKNEDLVGRPAHFPDHLLDFTTFFFKCHSIQPPRHPRQDFRGLSGNADERFHLKAKAADSGPV